MGILAQALLCSRTCSLGDPQISLSNTMLEFAIALIAGLATGSYNSASLRDCLDDTFHLTKQKGAKVAQNAGPALEKAKQSASPYLQQAQQTAMPYINQAKDQVKKQLSNQQRS